MGIFIVLMGYMSWFIQFKSTDVINNSYNSRQELYAEKVVRGKILSAEGDVLAETVQGADGKEGRRYPYGNLFSHVVGYSTRGKSGIENLGNLSLLRSNAFITERVKNDINEEKNPGDNLVTTLDLNLQQVAYEALGAYDGAIVVMEPDTGKVLAMVSKPDFDPNTIAADWEDITADEDSSVLVNRATQGLYPPGSVFKIVTLLEYMRENPAAYGSYSYSCSGKYTEGSSVINCYHGTSHGSVDLLKAFAKSCNAAFADIGSKLDAERFHGTAESLLFNQALPVQLPYNRSAFYVDAASDIDTILQSAIGQGKTQVTPMHMALLTAAAANGGVLMKPYFIERIENYSGDVIKQYSPQKYGKLMEAGEALVLTEYMEEVVQTGTGTKLRDLPYTAAGKTGSAEYSSEKKGESHAWFTGFAPAENPEIVVTVIVEEAGSGGDYAVPMAKRIFDAYFK